MKQKKNGGKGSCDTPTEFRSADSILGHARNGDSAVQRRRSWRTHYVRPKSTESGDSISKTSDRSPQSSLDVLSPLHVVTVDLLPEPTDRQYSAGGSSSPGVSPYSTLDALDTTFSSDGGSPKRRMEEFGIREDEEDEEDERSAGGPQVVSYRF